MDEKVKKLIEYVAEAAELESAFLQPSPSFYVFAESLLDTVSEIFGVDKSDVNKIVIEYMITKQRKNETSLKNSSFNVQVPG